MCDFLENLHFIVGSFEVLRSALLYFQSDIGVVLEILGKPNCGEVPPAEFLNNCVAVEEDFANVNRMVAANLIILDSFILAVMLLF